jgi:hypothetical protein
MYPEFAEKMKTLPTVKAPPAPQTPAKTSQKGGR